VPNPEFYPMLRNLGFKNLPDQSTMAAITFCDVVVSHEPFSNGLLFYELVHVEQYRQLGIPHFAELYVRGFLNGGSYEAIPLEVNAYSLEDRFRRDARHIFGSDRSRAMAFRRETLMDQSRRGRPLAIDHKAQSASAIEPAFVAPQDGAPVYHGFVVLDDVTVDGFTLGKITDWEADPCMEEDAFVIAPNGSRAGLVWEVCDLLYFQEVSPIERGRWGVWGVVF
jgi:hypothetical protein